MRRARSLRTEANALYLDLRGSTSTCASYTHSNNSSSYFLTIPKSALWERRRALYRKSGLARKAFCKKHHLKLSTLDYWFCVLGKLEKERRLVELDQASVAPLARGLIVGVGQDYRIELRRGFDPQLLAEVIQVLGAVR